MLVIITIAPVPIMYTLIKGWTQVKTIRAKVLVLGQNFADQPSTPMSQLQGGTSTIQIITGLSGSNTVKLQTEKTLGSKLEKLGVGIDSFSDTVSGQIVFEASSKDEALSRRACSAYLASTLNLAAEVGLDRDQFRLYKLESELKDLKASYLRTLNELFTKANAGSLIMDSEKSLGQIAESELQKIKLEQDIVSLQASIEGTKSQLLNSVSGGILGQSTDLEVEAMRKKFIEQREKVASLELTYNSANPKVRKEQLELDRIKDGLPLFIEKYTMNVQMNRHPSLVPLQTQLVALQKRYEKVKVDNMKLLKDTEASAPGSTKLVEIRSKIEETTKYYTQVKIKANSEPRKWRVLDSAYIEKNSLRTVLVKSIGMLFFYVALVVSAFKFYLHKSQASG